jgi:predicted GIY-YIG superfamily endonuclease
VLSGFNDLQTLYPKIAKEAYGWDPAYEIAGSYKKLTWKCPSGHVYDATLHNRTGVSNTGCPTCAKTGFDPNEAGYLYLLEHPTWELLQIGITNEPKKRLRDHKNLGWKPIEVKGPMEGVLAKQWESLILKTIKKKGIKLGDKNIAGNYSGYTETWSIFDLHIRKLSDLMKMAEEMEQ